MAPLSSAMEVRCKGSRIQAVTTLFLPLTQGSRSGRTWHAAACYIYSSGVVWWTRVVTASSGRSGNMSAKLFRPRNRLQYDQGIQLVYQSTRARCKSAFKT